MYIVLKLLVIWKTSICCSSLRSTIEAPLKMIIQNAIQLECYKSCYQPFRSCSVAKQTIYNKQTLQMNANRL